MTAVEWLVEQLYNNEKLFMSGDGNVLDDILEQAKEMEKEQMLKFLNVSAKEAYKAGQKTMYCGCYDIEDATTFEQWMLQKIQNL